jgi:hypothetical protein
VPARHIVDGEVIGAIGASFDMPEQDVQAEREMVHAGCWPCGYARCGIAEQIKINRPTLRDAINS